MQAAFLGIWFVPLWDEAPDINVVSSYLVLSVPLQSSYQQAGNEGGTDELTKAKGSKANCLSGFLTQGQQGCKRKSM